MPTQDYSNGYWTEGKIVNGTNVGGGTFVKGTPPQTKTAPEIVSSSSVLQSQQAQNAVVAGGNALTSSGKQNQLTPGSYVDQSGKLISPNDPGYDSKKDPRVTFKGSSGASNSVSNLSNSTQDLINSNMQSLNVSQTIAQRSMQAIDMSFNSATASKNFKYAELFSDMKKNFDTQVQTATNNAISLNPYSQSRGATTAQNFVGKLQNNFTESAIKLQRQADLAQKELEAGRYGSYVQIQNSMDQTAMDVIQKNQSAVMDFNKQVEQIRQYEQSFAGNQQNTWADNFRQQLQSIALEPEMVDEMLKSGSIFDDPTFQAGVNAGYSPEGVVESMKVGSLALKKQEDLERYRHAQLEAQNNRLIASQEKMTAAQMASAAAARVNTAHINMRANGMEYGTPEYVFGLARSSQGGTKPSQADKDRYIALDQVSSALGRIKNDVYALGDNKQIWNIAQAASKNPYSEEVTKFTAQMAGIATQIGKGIYGEGGRLSDDDVRRILSSVGNAYQSTNVREGLFNELVNKVQDAALSKLAADADAGVDVANYEYNVQRIVKQVNDVRENIPTKGTSATEKTNSVWTASNGKIFQLPNYTQK